MIVEGFLSILWLGLFYRCFNLFFKSFFCVYVRCFVVGFCVIILVFFRISLFILFCDKCYGFKDNCGYVFFFRREEIKSRNGI